MEKVLLIPILLSFFTVLFTTGVWIKRARNAGLKGKDMNKLSGHEVAEAGGIGVLMGFVLGVLSYVAITTFYFNSADNLIEIFCLISSVLLIGGMGFIDDILGWKIGLDKKTRLLLLLFAAIPLVVINAGESQMIGIEFGLFYPLFFIPLGIVGASATFNFLAGYNGLETSQGILILSALAFVTWSNGNSWLSLICAIMVACLFSFYLFNKYPSKVFPGDVLTYSVGALIAIVAILGNLEKIAVFFFIPYILETGLKVRGRLKKESFAKVNDDGSLGVPYPRFYGLEHIAIFLIGKRKKVRENDVVLLINLFQILVIGAGLIIFRNGIF